MASTFLDEKISSFIEDKFPEFVKNDHPVFVEFLREYFKFLEAAKITLTNVLGSDQILLENKLTVNYLANEFDDTRFIYEDSQYGVFLKDETVTGQTSGATSTILAEDNAGLALYVEANRHFQVGEIITGSTSGARATIGKYQGNPVQNIQQLLEYVNVDKTVNDYLDHFRETYLTAVPNTLATGVSKRKLVKSVRDLYRAKGTRKGHESFFRLMFDETPELTYPTENILKISAGDWSSDTVLRVVATENNPNNLVGQTISQTVNVGGGIGAASAGVEAILQLQEGETTVYQLILNVASIEGTFISGAEITGIDSTDVDVSISATVQSILVGATVTEGAAGYTTTDTVAISSTTGQNALISIVDVGSGEIDQVIIDNPGTGYQVGDPLFFDNANTEGSGASAIVSCIGGAVAPELGDTTDRTVTATLANNSVTITNITTTGLTDARQFTMSGKVTVGSTTITNITTKNFVVGSTIMGTGIPDNTKIDSIDVVGDHEDGTITISQAATSGGVTGGISSLTQSSGTATVTCSSAHNLQEFDTVSILGATPQAYNGIKSITVTSSTQFTFVVPQTGLSSPASGTISFTLNSRQKTLTHLEEESGQRITYGGTGLQPNTRIRQIITEGASNNGTITIDKTATASGSVTLTIPSEYGINTFDHIVYEDATESTDAYTGNQIMMEGDTFANLGDQPSNGPHYVAHGYYGDQIDSEGGRDSNNEFIGEVVNVTMFSPGSGYELMPTINPSTHKLIYNSNALTTSGTFVAGETISNNATPAATAIITTFVRGKITIAKSTGAFALGQIITGSTSGAKATLTSAPALGASATFLGWSSSGIGSISGVEVSNFGTGFSTAPAATVPVKMLLTRNTNVTSPPDITLATAFAAGDTIIGESSSARGVVTAWDNARQTLTVRTTQGTFQRSEILTRGSGTNYAILSEINQGALSTTIGTIGTTAGSFNNDKGKISESLMKIQDSYYYQDFSYVVKVGAAIKDWRAEIKKAVHPAGFAMFGEVSISNKVATLMTVPITGITTETPTLASLFEAVITTVVGRRLGTDLSGTAVPQSYPQQYYRLADVKFTPDQQIVLEDATTSADSLPDYLILEDEAFVDGILEGGGGYLLNEEVGSTVGSLTTVTNITTTNLAVGQEIWSPSLQSGTTIVSIDTASSGTHSNGEITISKAAITAGENEWFTISVPYTTEYSIANTLLGETEIKGTTNHVKGTLKRGYHLGHEPQLFSNIETITRSGTTATIETTGPHGVEPGEQIEISVVDTDGYNGVYEVIATATDDTLTITVPNTLTTPAVVGNGKLKLVSPFDNSTRDVTARPHTEVTVYPLYGEWATNQRSRYGLGPRQTNAIKYMWATPPTEYAGGLTDTLENHQILLETSTITNDDNLILEPDVLTDVDFTVTVAGGKFVVDSVSQSALELDGARFYRFDLSDSSVSGHPFRISETSDGTHAGGASTEYIGVLPSLGEEGVDAIDFEFVLETASETEGNTNYLILEDGNNIIGQTYQRVSTYGTAGTAGAYIDIFTENILQDLYYYCSNHSGMGSSLSITPRIGDYVINEDYQTGGAAAVENIILEDGGYILYETDTDPETQSVMVSEESTITYGSITEDAPNRLDGQMAYAYPNITRRESPESGTDNVDAGGAGVYDTTMNYINIQIGAHESNVHNRISDFADVRIVDIIKCGREVLELVEQTNKHEGDNDYHFTIMEDGSHIQMESGSAGIPLASRKIWNVPPPSYIRLTTS